MYYDYDDWGDWRRPQQAMGSCYTGSPTATLGASTAPDVYGPSAVNPAAFGPSGPANFAPNYQTVYQSQFPTTFPYPYFYPYPYPVPFPYFKHHSCHHHGWWW